MGEDIPRMTEREKFEEWMQREHPADNSLSLTSLARDDERPDEYMMIFTWAAWAGWQARGKVANAQVAGRLPAATSEGDDDGNAAWTLR